MKTSKNNAEKIHNVALTLPPAPDTRKPKKPRPKTRKNNKQTPPKPQQETKQRKQQHYFCSQKFYKHSKNKRRTQNIRKKIFWTKNVLGTNHKRHKGHQEDKTVQWGRPRVSQASCQQVTKKISVSLFKKKWTNQHFKKKKLKISIGREKGWNSTHSSFIGPCKTHKRIRGSQIVRITPTTCVSWEILVRYLIRDPVKFEALSVSAMWLT